MNYRAVVHAPTRPPRSRLRNGFQTPFIARTLLLTVIALAAGGGILLTDSAVTAQAVTSAGADWANLLRAMAALKLLFAGAATAAVLWRFGAPISAERWSAYALAAAVTWAGPGLIWGLAHIGLGTLLLHSGLIATAVLVWRDPATSERLSGIIARRRLASQAGG